jgi:hypothetical protein
LVALGIVPPANKDQVMQKLQSVQGTGIKYVVLAGTGTNHQVTLGGLSAKHRYYIRVYAVDASGNLSSYNAHTVKTPSSGLFRLAGNDVEWTEWLDRDDPGGAGDYETLKDLAAAVLTCDQPMDVECRTMDGRSWQEAGQKYSCDTQAGGVCVNAQQQEAVFDRGERKPPDAVPSRRPTPLGTPCLDYEVRFLCPVP